MNSLYCRAFQQCLKLANNFVGYRTPEYIEGPGCITGLAGIIDKRGIKSVLLVTGKNITKRGLTKGFLDALAARGISCTAFTDASVNPTSDDVEAGLRAYRAGGCQAIIAFGGGTPMDCAKAIGARAARPDKSVYQLQGLLKVGRRIPPLFAVPTTSGTGSETTLAAVITDSCTHRKASINDPHLIPDLAVLDPQLTLGLPPFVTATTGMDALCHAVEAYTNRTYNTGLENRLAVQAVQLIRGNLYTAYKNGSDITARQNMQKAAFFAGRAFTRGCVGYVHAVGHTLGGLYGVPHGLAMAVILPHVMRQYGKAVYRPLSELAQACGISGGSDRERALGFIAWIDELNSSMGIPSRLDMIKDEDIPQMIRWAMKEANPVYPVPEIWDAGDFEKLIASIRA